MEGWPLNVSVLFWGAFVIGKYRHYLPRKNSASIKGGTENPECSLRKLSSAINPAQEPHGGAGR